MTTLRITKDTVLCISLAGRPSNLGTRFHNHLYEELGLDYVYKAFTTGDLAGAIGAVRALGIRGCGVSMPYKEECIAYVDDLDPSARAIESVNTIVNTDGVLHAYNTDYVAIGQLLERSRVSTSEAFAVAGSGGMAKAVVAALRDAGFERGVVIARNQETGAALAEKYGYPWQAAPRAPGTTEDRAALLVNATPMGMAGGPAAGELAFPEEMVRAASTVFEVVAMPAETPLVRLARSLGMQVIAGTDVSKIQALEQFVLYTGVRPTDQQAQRAAEYSRS